MEKNSNIFTKDFPEWAGRIVTPVQVSDLGRQHSFCGTALWDTGAEISVISKCVADACRLQDFITGNRIQHFEDERDVKIGVVLIFPGDIRKFIPLSVAVLDGANRDVDVVLGMDIIGRGDFSLTRKGDILQMKFIFGDKFIDA